MAKHEVAFDIPKRPLRRADIELTIKDNGPLRFRRPTNYIAAFAR